MVQINYDAIFSGARSKDEITKAFRTNFDALMASYNNAVANFGKAGAKVKSKPAKVTKTAETDAVPALDAAEVKVRKPRTSPDDTKKDTSKAKGATKVKAATKTKAEPAQTEKKAAEEVPCLDPKDRKAIKSLDITLHQYTDKSFAITGDTKPLRSILKKLKGAFNRNLSVGEGWIFSNKYLPEVKAALYMK